MGCWVAMNWNSWNDSHSVTSIRFTVCKHPCMSTLAILVLKQLMHIAKSTVIRNRSRNHNHKHTPLVRGVAVYGQRYLITVIWRTTHEGQSLNFRPHTNDARRKYSLKHDKKCQQDRCSPYRWKRAAITRRRMMHSMTTKSVRGVFWLVSFSMVRFGARPLWKGHL